MDKEIVAQEPFGEIATLDKSEIRGFIAHIEKIALELGSPVEVETKHHFSKSVYAREMRMPKGAMVVGKIHKHENLNILSAGEASVLSVDGVMRIKAPYTFVAQPGAKRVIYAHTDLVWTNVHGTDERDLVKIEEQFIAPTYDDVAWIAGQEYLKLQGE